MKFGFDQHVLELESHSNLHSAGIRCAIGLQEKWRTHDATGYSGMLRIESVVQVCEHVHLGRRRFATCSLSQFVRFREVQAYVKVARTNLSILHGSRRPVVYHTVVIVVFASGDGVEGSAMRIQYRR